MTSSGNIHHHHLPSQGLMSFILEAGEFFKREEKLPFQFSAIEERRSGTNYFVWIIVIILALIILTVVNTFLHL